MLWFLIVGLIGPNGDTGESFVYTDPTFDSVEECIEYAQDNALGIHMEMMANYGTQVGDMFCGSEEMLKESMKAFDMEKSI